jgi:hypothetical protein
MFNGVSAINHAIQIKRGEEDEEFDDDSFSVCETFGRDRLGYAFVGEPGQQFSEHVL